MTNKRVAEYFAPLNGEAMKTALVRGVFRRHWSEVIVRSVLMFPSGFAFALGGYIAGFLVECFKSGWEAGRE